MFNITGLVRAVSYNSAMYMTMHVTLSPVIRMRKDVNCIVLFPSLTIKLQGKRRSDEGREESCEGGGRVKVYLHAVTDAQARRLENTGRKHFV